ncbi:MAG TPA: hypothetical protein VGN81_41160 [Pseudonocardiaceae bacterium]|jgi:hypothetical protein
MDRHAEAVMLSELGAVFRAADLPGVEVRLPRSLADAAVSAWERNDADPVDGETHTQRQARHRAGILALIGLCVSEAGEGEGDEVVVTLPVEFIGAAMIAEDEQLTTVR